jgi:Holliday junction DNA helicase RuvB
VAKNFSQSSLCEQDLTFELPLRPQSLGDFVGQESVRERLEVLVGAALGRGEPLGHCLFCGPPGLGKTTLANILAKAMGTNLIVTSGPVLDKAGDLAGILTSLKRGDILFIDEIHRLSRVVEEYLYPAMEDFSIDLKLESGANARLLQMKLERFTLVGATTRIGQLSAPLRSRFLSTTRLDYYEPKVLQKILNRTAKLLDVTMTEEGSLEIARRSRGTPRIANNLLRWVRDYAQIRADGNIDKEIAHAALSMLSIDEAGLDELDKRLLTVLIDHYAGGPVGLGTLATAISEEKATIEEVHEPYLIMQGFLKRTPRGRVASPQAFRHLGRAVPQSFSPSLFGDNYVY